MLHVWSHSIGTLHMAPLIFLCCPLQAVLLLFVLIFYDSS